MNRLSERVQRLEQHVRPGTLGPITAAEMMGLDDCALLRYAIRGAKRDIAAGAGSQPLPATCQVELGVTNNHELLALLQGWLAETEGRTSGDGQ